MSQAHFPKVHMTDSVQGEHIIEIMGLAKRFKMGTETVEALKDVSMTISKGMFSAIAGPSGSGKSTLMNIIGCLDSPTEGTYILRGDNVSNLSENDLADVRNREIGFVFQTFNLLPKLSAVDNVSLPLVYAGVGRQRRTEAAREMLKLVGLGNRETHRPNQLSGGQCQRVAIARALINSPSILLADEPTGNLDSGTTSSIMELFEGLHERGNTIVLVTHEEHIASRAQIVFHLEDGTIARRVWAEAKTRKGFSTPGRASSVGS